MFISATSDCWVVTMAWARWVTAPSWPWSTAYWAMCWPPRWWAIIREEKRSSSSSPSAAANSAISASEAMPGCSVWGTGAMPIHSMALSRSRSGLPQSSSHCPMSRDSPAWTMMISSAAERKYGSVPPSR